MALIQCCECGKEISDKASKCIHCGAEVVKTIQETAVEEVEVVKNCEECGAELSDTDVCCCVCGCPVEVLTEETSPEKGEVEAVGEKAVSKTKKIIIFSVVALIVCIVSIFAVKYAGEVKAEKEFVIAYNEYIDDLEKIQTTALTGGAEAEGLCNLTYRVWFNAIYEKNDGETDPYTRPSGNWVGDFNEAINNLYDASSTGEKVSTIAVNQSEVKELMKKLQNPPEGLEQCYDTVGDLHSAYKILTDLAISPAGNLTGFCDKSGSAVSDFMGALEKLETQIPEKKEEK